QSEPLGVLHQETFNVAPQRLFPGVADADIEYQRGYSNNRHEYRHSLEEDSVPHLAASNLYPVPRIVFRYLGSSGSGSIFSRSRLTYTSPDRGVTNDMSRQTASSTWSRV